jgi:imidazolonepropionase-like amidohydrolase
MTIRAALCTLIAALPLTARAAEIRNEEFSIMRQGETIGQLTAQSSADSANITIRYIVRNNGRGPTIDEALVVDADGLPVRWSVTGTTTYGGQIREQFEFKRGVARWHSSSERGESRVARLYIPKDASPWRYGLFARALLKAPEHRLPTLPSGSLSLEKLGPVDAGQDNLSLTLYELKGADLAADHIVLDDRGMLFAHLGQGPAGMTIRKGHETLAPRLTELAMKIAQDQAVELQAKLARRFEGPVHIKNVRVFDAQGGRTSAAQSVVVIGDRIATIASGIEPRPGDTVIDAEGGTLVPGLFNMHMHDSLRSGPLLLAAGVTSVRDMGSDNLILPKIVRAIESGAVAGPRITMNGLIEGRSPYSVRIGTIAQTLEQALDSVRWYADHGYRQIKIYSSVNPDWVKPLSEEARRLGLGVSGHVPAFSHVDRAINEGYQDVAHINQLVLSWILPPGEDTRSAQRITAMARARDLDLRSERVQRTIALMRERNVRLDTTIMVFERLLLSRAGRDPIGDVSYINHMPIAHQRLLRSDFTNAAGEQDEAAYQAGFDKLLEVLAQLHRSGIQLLPGTDDVVETGFGLHRELELYVKAGIPPADTLRLATIESARYLGVDQATGSIERGKLADFFLVPSDPAEDISAIRKVRMVMRGGQLYFPSEIYREYGIEPFIDPPPLTPVRDRH